ncbi:Hsp20/alpha crystallin family protein [bacterium]|nr:Hsp20/alpha crystallin family protein [bacterium]MBU1651903.1 Hsp20/alpha crystallin family protein [bacterium]
MKYRPAASLMNPFFDEGWMNQKKEEDRFLVPRSDILERKDKYVIYVEMPGVSKDDFKVDLESNILTIRGSKEIHEKVDGEQFVRVERQCGDYRRSFRLGEEINAEKIKAKYSDGLLELTLPKAEQVKPKSIQIEVK